MFGIDSFGIWFAYLLCILSAIACIVYGVMNWNKGSKVEDEQIKQGAEWQKEEVKIEENL